MGYVCAGASRVYCINNNALQNDFLGNDRLEGWAGGQRSEPTLLNYIISTRTHTRVLQLAILEKKKPIIVDLNPRCTEILEIKVFRNAAAAAAAAATGYCSEPSASSSFINIIISYVTLDLNRLAMSFFSAQTILHGRLPCDE